MVSVVLIYIMSFDENGRYSAPVNLGPGINTEGNEVFPFIFRDDVIFLRQMHTRIRWS